MILILRNFFVWCKIQECLYISRIKIFQDVALAFICGGSKMWKDWLPKNQIDETFFLILKEKKNFRIKKSPLNLESINRKILFKFG